MARTQHIEGHPRLTLTPDELVAAGQRVTHLRKTFHLIHGGELISQDVLAREVGITRDALAKYERGERAASIRTIQDLAFVLRVDPVLITTQARRVFATAGTPLSERVPA